MHSIANGPEHDRNQSMYERPYPIDKFARAAAALASGFTKLHKKLTEYCKLYLPLSFFKFNPEIAGRLESYNMSADVRQIAEDGMSTS